MAENVYLAVLDRMEQVEVAAFVEIDAAKREALARRRPAAAVCERVGELPEGLDAALVLTPVREGLDGHYEPVLELLDRGLPVLCEKPLSLRLERVREMCARSHGSGRLLMMTANRRFCPVYVWAREQWGERGLSQLYAEKSGRGTFAHELITNSIHLLDALRWWGGEVASMQALIRRNDAGHELGTLVLLEFETGAHGVYRMSREAGQWLERMEAHGRGATIRVEAPHRAYFVAGEHVRSFAPDDHRWLLPEPERWGFDEQIAHFLACVRGAEQPQVDAAEALRTHELIFAILEAAGPG